MSLSSDHVRSKGVLAAVTSLDMGGWAHVGRGAIQMLVGTRAALWGLEYYIPSYEAGVLLLTGATVITLGVVTSATPVLSRLKENGE